MKTNQITLTKAVYLKKSIIDEINSVQKKILNKVIHPDPREVNSVKSYIDRLDKLEINLSSVKKQLAQQNADLGINDLIYKREQLLRRQKLYQDISKLNQDTSVRSIANKFKTLVTKLFRAEPWAEIIKQLAAIDVEIQQTTLALNNLNDSNYIQV
jgi:hypothetical protein